MNQMQKLINVLALLSFAGVAGIIGGGTYLYLQKDVLIDGVKEQVTKHATEAITNALPGMLDAAMPEIPKTTGAPIPGGVPSL
jgi:hypothetical protein